MKKIKRIIRTVLYRLNYYRSKNAQLKGINMGGGGDKIEEFISIDADLGTDCDIVAYLEDPIKYNNNSVQYIYNSHVVEHISRKKIRGILSDWSRILKPGGKLYLCVPDMEAVFGIYLENIKNYENFENRDLADFAMEVVYGGQKDQYDFHKHGYSFAAMKYLMEGCGFKNVKLFKHEDVDFLTQIHDAGSSAHIHGKGISLNIEAEKA